MAVVSMCSIDAEYPEDSGCDFLQPLLRMVRWGHFHERSLLRQFPREISEEACGYERVRLRGLKLAYPNPSKGDYTEEYQAYYHEELIKQLFTRPFIWATHVWNMFDFAADSEPRRRGRHES